MPTPLRWDRTDSLPYYQELGIREGDRWLQLNACLLQTESEVLRPESKRVGLQGERPALALQRYGVQYVEMRLFDLNPFIDIGIAPEQSLFADTLLLMCLLRTSPPITAREQGENDENKHRVVTRWRQPGLQLLLGITANKLCAPWRMNCSTTWLPLLPCSTGPMGAPPMLKPCSNCVSASTSPS